MLNALLGSPVTRKLRTVYHPMSGNPDSRIRHILDHYIFSGKPPTYPFPKPTLTLTPHLGKNVGLGEGLVGSFPRTYNDPKFLLVESGLQLWIGIQKFQWQGILDQETREGTLTGCQRIFSFLFCYLCCTDGSRRKIRKKRPSLRLSVSGALSNRPQAV